MNIEDIRRENLNTLVEERGGHGALVAIAADSKTSASYLSQIKTRIKTNSGKIREVGSKLARKLERGCNKPVGWMDERHNSTRPKMASEKTREVRSKLALKPKKVSLKPVARMNAKHDDIGPNKGNFEHFSELGIIYLTMDKRMQMVLLDIARVISKIGK